MERKLVTVQRIATKTPIEGADRIVTYTMEGLGWYCVGGKDQFNVGDDVCYFEIDSFIPTTKYDFEFLRASCLKKFIERDSLGHETIREGFKIKTRKFKKQISQGLIMPMSVLPLGKYTIGQDVSQLLGVVKYEPPMPKALMGTAKAHRPDFVPKTDETRVQVLQKVISKHKGTECYVTEKINGSSVSYYLNDDVETTRQLKENFLYFKEIPKMFGVCSREIDLDVNNPGNVDNAYIKWAKDNNVEQKLRLVNRNVVIQGEIYGNGLNGNNLKMNTIDVRFFNVWDIDRMEYLSFYEFVKFIKSLGFETVPILETNYILEDNVDNIVKKAVGKSVLNKDVWREGIVIRPLQEKTDIVMAMSEKGNNGRLTFKAINPEHLLVDEES